MTELSDRQRDVLRFLCRFLVTHQRPPSLREIGGAMGIGSTNGVSDRLKALAKKGFVYLDGTSRGIRVVKSEDGLIPVIEFRRGGT